MSPIDKKSLTQEFPVDQTHGIDEKFFRVITPGGEVRVDKFKFQYDQPLPETLSCRVKGYDGDKPVLMQNTAAIVSEFYAEANQRGQEFSFRVVRQPSPEHPYYRLEDENGLLFKLHDRKSVLVNGQMVKCRFERLDSTGFSVRRSSTDTNLPMLYIKDITSGANIHNFFPAREVEDMLYNTPELEQAAKEYSEGNPSWVLSAVRAIDSHLAEWFVEGVRGVLMPRDKEWLERVSQMLRAYKQVSLFLLEGSTFLRRLALSERKQLQMVLGEQIDRIEIYTKALYTICSGEQKKYINRVLHNLKQSGYLYRPHVQLAVMMTLFRVVPTLVNSSLRNIFDTLMEWSPETWTAEPFRRAFVDQLEFYINDAAAKVDTFEQPTSDAQTQTLENVLTAIAIHHALLRSTDRMDTRLNMTRFYRFLSVLRPAKAEVLLRKSFLTFMGVDLPVDFNWNDIKEPTMMMTRAAVDLPARAVIPEDADRFFTAGKVLVEIGSYGIEIRRTDEPTAQNCLPNSMISWPETKIFINPGYSLTPSKLRQIEKHREFWAAVEDKLLGEKAATVPTRDSKKMLPDINDVVTIVIDRIGQDENGYLFTCHVDEPYFEGDGLISGKELISYNIRSVSAGTFRHNDGSPMRLKARVIDIDDNDKLIFSMLEFGKSKAIEMGDEPGPARAVITKDNGATYSAISERGYGLFINHNSELPPMRPGSVVLYDDVHYNGYNDSLTGTCIEGPLDGERVENSTCVRNMLLAMAEPKDDETNMDSAAVDDDDPMTTEDMVQVIELLRYQAAALRNNLIGAFDTLSLAYLLARIIRHDELSQVIRAQIRAVELYQSFDKNRQIFSADIDAMLALAPENPLIQRHARRLQIVAALGNSDANAMLWKLAGPDTANEPYREMAQMALSYNLLYDVNRDDPAAAQIKENIARALNDSTEQTELKYYGSESQYVEFKSSLVYPAAKGRRGISAADPDKQEFEILHIIAGMLNTTGGTLYIGVGDDHYERGLSEDLRYYEMAPADKTVISRRNIRSIDNLANHLQQLIDSRFSIGKLAGEYAKTGIDDDSTKGVITVKVLPCPHVVYLGGELFARHGSKTEPYTDPREIETFVAEREAMYRNLTQASAPKPAKTDAPALDAPAPAEAKPKKKASAAAADPAPAATETFVAEQAEGKIATSLTRHNVLHDYEDPDHYVEPEFYLRFTGNNEYVVTRDEWNFVDAPDELVLAIRSDEIDGYLLIVYEGEYAVKVPIREIMAKTLDTPHSFNSEHKIVFAAPCTDADALYCVLLNSKQSVMERLTPVTEIEQGSASSAPARILDSDVAQSTLWTVVPEDKKVQFSQALSTQMKRNQIGTLVKSFNSARVTIDDARSLLLKKLK